MFIAVLLAIAKLQRQPKCPLMDEWIKKMWYICIYIMGVCSVISDPLQPHGLQPPCSSVHGIFQARVLEWIAISSFRASSWLRDWTCISCVSYIDRQVDSFPLSHLGSPVCVCVCVCVYGSLYYSTFEKKEILLFHIHVDESRWYYAKWNKPDKDTSHMVSLI